MELAEKTITKNNVQLREIRKRSNDGHQTSIISTNKKIISILMAIKMFARWTQENFFKYLRKEYDLDHIVHYITNQLDEDIKVVNPLHRKLTRQLKKVREKIARRLAKLYQLVHVNVKEDTDKTAKNLKQQSEIKEEVRQMQTEENEILTQRAQQSYKIKVKQMKEEVRYNKLDFESKLLQNIIKMICYRAETNFSILLAANYKRKTDEMRALTKSLINTKANIIPDYKNEILTVELYSLSNPRDNMAAIEICQTLNETETIFPGTNLKLFYKFPTP